MISLFVTLLIILLVIIVAFFIKDRREIKKKTVETIGDDLWREMDRERQESLEKGIKFRKMLNEAKAKSRNP